MKPVTDNTHSFVDAGRMTPARVTGVVLLWLLVVARILPACTLWGFNPVGDTTIGDEPQSGEAVAAQLEHLQLQGGSGPNWPWCNDSGWSLAFYSAQHPGELPPEQTWRAVGAAYTSSYFDSVAAVMATDLEQQVQLAIGHTRSASAGAADIPDPHPFVEQRSGTDLAFIHNGTVSKELLRGLIGDDWLTEHPPQTWSEDDWTTPEGWERVVDSELLFFWLLVNIADCDGDLVAGLQLALNAIRLYSGDRNFLLFDGADIYAYRGTGPSGSTSEPPQLWCQTGTGAGGSVLYHAVTTLPADTSGGDWWQVPDDALVVLPVLGPVSLLENFAAGEPDAEQPAPLVLGNYPNPFGNGTTITWRMPEAGNVTLTLYDLLGRRMADLYHGTAGQGENSLFWNGCTDQGLPAACGMYILTGNIGGELLQHRLTLIR